MIQQFICKDAECPNFDIVYNMETNGELVECGGCKVMLEAVDE